MTFKFGLLEQTELASITKSCFFANNCLLSVACSSSHTVANQKPYADTIDFAAITLRYLKVFIRVNNSLVMLGP